MNKTTALRKDSHNWRVLAGLDFDTLATLLQRGWGVLSGLASILFLPAFLSSPEQGYYYTFASVLALQVFFELGLNQIILQLVSHEVANLTITASGNLSGSASQLSRLASLARLIGRWYGVAAIAFILIAGPAGIIFFAQKQSLPVSTWLGPWIGLVLSTALNLWYSPGLTVMEASGKVGQVARLRLMQAMVMFTVFWPALFSGAGLWACMVGPAIAAISSGYWLRKRGTMLSWLARQPVDPANMLMWRRDVLPFQWRIALSWVSGYFIFSVFTPLIFWRQGSVEAGRLGMALSVFNAVSTIGMSWINAKSPSLTMHVSRNERESLRRVFKAVATRSILFTAAASAAVVLLAATLTGLGVAQMARIAPVSVLTLLGLVTVLNTVVFTGAVFMRAHKEEPMLTVSIVTAALVGMSAYFGSQWGTLPMMSLYLIFTILVSLPWTAILFRKYWKR